MKARHMGVFGVLFAVPLALSLGCASTSSPVVHYGDAQAVETVNSNFGSTDLQMIASKMVDSLLQSPVLGSDRPVIVVAPIKNKTSEHIDTQAITSKIRTAILKSGKARFAAGEYENEVLDQLDFQSSGLVDTGSAAEYGRQVGAEFVLTGTITSIVKRAGRVKDVYYNVNLTLINVQQGLIEWSDEKEIRKGTTRRLIGR